jgi:hypothetical protein
MSLCFYCVFQALEQAAGMSIQVLHTRHVEVWQELWTTGFGISHSYADNAINGAQVMITVVEKPWGTLGFFRQLLTGQLKLEKKFRLKVVRIYFALLLANVVKIKKKIAMGSIKCLLLRSIQILRFFTPMK